MRVIVAHHLADDLRALAMTPRLEASPIVAHAVEHAPVRRLQPVADVRQRSPDDHAHRVIHVRALHLVFDVDGDFIEAKSDIGSLATFGLVRSAVGAESPDSSVGNTLEWRLQPTAWQHRATRSDPPNARAPTSSDIQVLHVQRIVFDELAARLDLIAHQRREHQVRLRMILGAHLQQRPLGSDPSWSPTACPGSFRRDPCSD